METTDNRWLLEAQQEILAVDVARKRALQLYQDYELASADLEKRLKALRAKLDLPNIVPRAKPPAEVEHLRPSTSRKGKGPRNLNKRIVEMLMPGTKTLDQMVAELGATRTYLHHNLLPRLAKDGLIINDLGNWRITTAGLRFLGVKELNGAADQM
jgi:hypothetical protein